MGIGPRPIREPHECEALLDSPWLRVPEADVLRHGEMGEEGSLLEDHADPPALGLDPCALANDPLAADVHRPCVRHLEPGHDAEHGGLSRPARAEQRDDFAFDKRHGCASNGAGLAEGLLDADGLDCQPVGHLGQHMTPPCQCSIGMLD